MCKDLDVSRSAYYEWCRGTPSKRCIDDQVMTQRNKSQRAAPDLVKRQFTVTSINQLWVADMTYLPIWAGFIYLD